MPAYFSRTTRDAAIERAVLIANGDASADAVIESLDTLAAAQKV